MTTLLTIVQEAVDEIGAIARPTAVYTSTDPTVRRMLVMSNREGRDLMRAFPWTVLQRLHTFTTTASTEEYSLPSDFDRLLPDTEWDRQNHEPLIGATSVEEWESIKSGLIGSGMVGRRYRIVRSASSTSRTMRIDPTPTASGETLAYWYVSKNWCASSGGTAQAAWAADTDTTLLDRDLMTLGLIVRYKRSIGLEFASEADEYAQILARTKAQDRPSRTLNLVPYPGQKLLGWANIPETGLTG